MIRRQTIVFLGSAAVLIGGPTVSPSDDKPSDFFESRVRPLLVDRCFKCHRGETAKSGLDMSSRQGLIAGGERGPAVIPNRPDESILVQAVRQTSDLKMPPKGKLTEHEIDQLVQWIRDGAVWPQTAAPADVRLPRDELAKTFWAFQPIKLFAVPRVVDPSFIRSPIDRFILVELQRRRLFPAGAVDKRTLIRRATFDLHGLPPTREEIDDFLRDRRADAFERVVDRLLASPRYGERWGRHWMDVVRYADTAGDNADYPIPEMYRYRDYILDSFNRDKPYDEFVHEQLAGDILANDGPPEKYAERVVATGFLALSRRYATAPFELWHLTLEDAIETTGRAFLGMTLRCARCHDHKFDPVTMEDYYGLYGIFASTRFPYAGSEEFQSKSLPRSGFVPLLPPPVSEPIVQSYRQSIAQLESQIQELETSSDSARLLRTLTAELEATKRQRQSPSVGNQSTEALDATIRKLEREQQELTRQRDGQVKAIREKLQLLKRPGVPAGLATAYAVQEGDPIDAAIQIRGEPSQPSRVVPRQAIGFLASGNALAIGKNRSGRLELARWLTRPDHPLTARVMVNRIWQYHFGKGLVRTPSNFGVNGERPTHPELLDWLAVRFVESGWSIKAMHRLIMRSAAYQLASTQIEENMPRDSGNDWYWRFDRRRLDAEAIRDAMLAVSGQLDLRRPGPHAFPPIAAWNWTQHSPFKADYPANHRTVYLMTQRIQRHPYLALFDGPDPNQTTDARMTSTVPLQALYLMNSSFVREQAEALARQVLARNREHPKRIHGVYEQVFGRSATNVELQRAERFLSAVLAELTRLGVWEPEREVEGWTSFVRVVLTSNEFLFVE
jgi:hypothetical protein